MHIEPKNTFTIAVEDKASAEDNNILFDGLAAHDDQLFSTVTKSFSVFLRDAHHSIKGGDAGLVSGPVFIFG